MLCCDACGKWFHPARSEEEARAESRVAWGELPEEDLAVVCDSCYRAMFGENGRQ
jgi:hypothetical protein